MFFLWNRYQQRNINTNLNYQGFLADMELPIYTQIRKKYILQALELDFFKSDTQVPETRFRIPANNLIIDTLKLF